MHWLISTMVSAVFLALNVAMYVADTDRYLNLGASVFLLVLVVWNLVQGAMYAR